MAGRPMAAARHRALPSGPTAPCSGMRAAALPPRPCSSGSSSGSSSGRRRQGPTPPCSFMPSLDVPALVPSWLLPGSPASPSEARRQARLRELRRALQGARRARPVTLPPPPPDDGAVDEAALGASNAVPFTTPGPPGSGSSPPCASLAVTGAAGGAARAEQAVCVLPWLLAVEGRLDLAGMEALASQLALSGLQLLDISRYAAASVAAPGGRWHNGWVSHVRWAGQQALPSPAVAAAAALRRMELRRGGALLPLNELEGKAVVVAYHPAQRQLAAETLALYLHAYHSVSFQEAAEAAGAAMGSSPVRATLQSYLEEMALIADGWYRRVTLAWPYAGGHVEIVGEAVGGWEQRAPMVFDVKRKLWKLQIWGLQPGIHRFKYLVDGCWVIDLAAHTEADSKGNINNVVMVTSSGKPLLRPGPDGTTLDMGGTTVASLELDDSPELAAAAAAAQASGALPTAEPLVLAAREASSGSDVALTAEEAEATLEMPPPPPWSSAQEMEAMARFGAAVLAFHTRLGLQLRHVMH